MRRLATLYVRCISVAGLGLWVGVIVLSAPWKSVDPITLQAAAILFILTFLSTLSPVPTRVGGTLSVSIAPLFGAIVFPIAPWMVMTLAALGTIDRRIPGRDIPWDNFLFNRGQFVLSFGL